MSLSRFEQHIFQTYSVLRIAMAVVCGLLGVGLIVAGSLLGIPIQPTLSDYYYVELPPAYLRVAFVALLLSLGVMLVAYRGYTGTDNRIHNAAGLFSIGIAVFPMKCPFPEPPDHALHAGCVTASCEYFKSIPYQQFKLCVTTPWDGLHYIFAVGAFTFAFWSICHGGGKKFKKLLSASVRRKLKHWQIGCCFVIGVGVLFPAGALFFGHERSLEPYVVVAESSAFLGFGVYWLVLTWCVSKVNEQRRQQRQIEAPKKQQTALVRSLAVAKKQQAPVRDLAVNESKADEEFDLHQLEEIP